MDRAADRTELVHKLERRGIADPRVLEAVGSVPRDRFVPSELQAHAYADRALAIGFEQTISQPYMIAVMLQALALTGKERVLEIGAGSGYQAALLGRLAGEVHTLEIVPELALRARETLGALGVSNVTVYTRDGSGGLAEKAPFDAISVAAAAPRLPPLLTAQLAEGGRLILPIGEPHDATLTLITRRGAAFETKTLGGCAFVPLVGNFGVAD